MVILLSEPDSESYTRAIEAVDQPKMSAATYLESGVVIDHRGDELAPRAFERFVRRAKIEIVPFDSRQAEIARQAYRDFGKGRHPAGLNFGDCFSYALAKALDEPLLFKGGDFSRTDVQVCPL